MIDWLRKVVLDSTVDNKDALLQILSTDMIDTHALISEIYTIATCVRDQDYINVLNWIANYTVLQWANDSCLCTINNTIASCIQLQNCVYKHELVKKFRFLKTILKEQFPVYTLYINYMEISNISLQLRKDPDFDKVFAFLIKFASHVVKSCENLEKQTRLKNLFMIDIFNYCFRNSYISEFLTESFDHTVVLETLENYYPRDYTESIVREWAKWFSQNTPTDINCVDCKNSGASEVIFD
jgi:hypothetical protein